jgi:hypothetical protein
MMIQSAMAERCLSERQLKRDAFQQRAGLFRIAQQEISGRAVSVTSRPLRSKSGSPISSSSALICWVTAGCVR